MISFDHVQAMQIDVLKEVGNIGAGNAATALSALLDKPVDMTVPTAKLIPFSEITESLGGDESVVTAVYLRVFGDVPGNLFFILTEDAVSALLYELFHCRIQAAHMNELERSAIAEIGNILAGSYLSSLAEFTSLHLTPSVPSITIDMAGAVLSFGLIQAGTMGNKAVMIDTAFNEGKKNEIQAHIFLIPDPQSLPVIFTALGVPSE